MGRTTPEPGPVASSRTREGGEQPCRSCQKVRGHSVSDTRLSRRPCRCADGCPPPVSSSQRTEAGSVSTEAHPVRVRQGCTVEASRAVAHAPSAPLPAGPFPAPDQCLRLAGPGLRGPRLLRDALPLPQPVRGRGLLGPRASAHGRDPLQVQQLPGKAATCSPGFLRPFNLMPGPGRGELRAIGAPPAPPPPTPECLRR